MTDQTPGWYPHQDGSGRLNYLNESGQWIDPFVAFEEASVDMLVPVLERVFEAGFEAGAEAAAKLQAVQGMIR